MKILECLEGRDYLAIKHDARFRPLLEVEHLNCIQQFFRWLLGWYEETHLYKVDVGIRAWKAFHKGEDFKQSFSQEMVALIEKVEATAIDSNKKLVSSFEKIEPYVERVIQEGQRKDEAKNEASKQKLRFHEVGRIQGFTDSPVVVGSRQRITDSSWGSPFSGIFARSERGIPVCFEKNAKFSRESHNDGKDDLTIEKYQGAVHLKMQSIPLEEYDNDFPKKSLLALARKLAQDLAPVGLPVQMELVKHNLSPRDQRERSEVLTNAGWQYQGEYSTVGLGLPPQGFDSCNYEYEIFTLIEHREVPEIVWAEGFINSLIGQVRNLPEINGA